MSDFFAKLKCECVLFHSIYINDLNMTTHNSSANLKSSKLSPSIYFQYYTFRPPTLLLILELMSSWRSCFTSFSTPSRFWKEIGQMYNIYYYILETRQTQTITLNIANDNTFACCYGNNFICTCNLTCTCN